ncbi:Cytochrome p450 [Globisporangium polare]
MLNVSALTQLLDSIDAKRLLDVFTMDVFAKIGSGVDFNRLKSNENQPFADAFERVSRNLFVRYQFPIC